MLRHRPFAIYLTGVVFSQIGSKGTFAAMMFHMYLLTGSTVQVGLVGLARGAALLLLSPIGGYCADRWDRRRLLQAGQALSMVISLSLAVATLAGAARAWHVLLAAMLAASAESFDAPARQVIIPAIVPPGQLVRGIALINPTNQIGKLAGPAIGGLLIAVGGPGLMYLFDALSFVGLIAILQLLTIPPLRPGERTSLGMWGSIAEGGRFIVRRPIIMQFMALDLSATLFTAYRVVLPALAVDVYQVGATGYGVLGAAPPAGALLGAAVAYRLAGMSLPSGRIVIASTMALGASTIWLGQVRTFGPALVAVGLVGLFDAVATTIRLGAVLLETPDAVRGRVSALYRMASGTGPSVGELNVGWLAGLLGVATALTVGGAVPVLFAAAVVVGSRQVRDYRANGG